MRRLALAFVLFLAASASAWAIDFTQPLVDLDDKPVKDANGATITLGEIAATGLLAQFADESPAGEEKVKRFLLATKVRQATDAKLTADEIALIKKLVAKGFNPLTTARMW